MNILYEFVRIVESQIFENILHFYFFSIIKVSEVYALIILLSDGFQMKHFIFYISKDKRLVLT